MKLPEMTSRSVMRPSVRTAFGGLNHNLSAGDGEIYAMQNLSGREYPLLTPRQKRGLLTALTTPGGVGAGDDVWWIDGTGFYYGGVRKGTVTSGMKTTCAMGDLVLIFPDKKYYDVSSGEFGSMEESWQGGAEFCSGTYAGVSAKANTIRVENAEWSFRPGDGVTISGCVVHPENNKTVVVREVEGDELRFYENTLTLDRIWVFRPEEETEAGTYHFQPEEETLQFTLASDLTAGDSLTWDGTTMTASISGSASTISVTGGSGGVELSFTPEAVDYEETAITIARTVPDLEHFCVNENRLWGCSGSMIYASALGDPFNFNVFDGLSTDSWQSSTLDAGEFTACVSYLGYPVCFKEEAVYKVYGDKPSNFQWTPSSRLGVKRGCHNSLAVAGETLFYLSRVGVCAYTGGVPALISDALGANTRWSGAAAGSDGVRYYISMTDGENWHLFVYDSRYQIWHREDDAHALGFAFWDGGLGMLCVDGKLWRVDGAKGTAEGAISWSAEFADSDNFYETTDTNSQNRKGTLRLLIRASITKDSTITVKLRYDDGAASTVGTLTGETGAKKKSYIIPLILRRCDHYRLSLDGTGDAVIYSITMERYSGSQYQGSSDVTLPNSN